MRPTRRTDLNVGAFIYCFLAVLSLFISVNYCWPLRLDGIVTPVVPTRSLAWRMGQWCWR